MVRVRLYGLVLSLPLILILGGVLGGFVSSNPAAYKTCMILIGAGIGLQLLFGLAIACPKCGKSPYAIGPTLGPFALAGKPWPDDKCSRCGHEFTPRAEKDPSV